MALTGKIGDEPDHWSDSLPPLREVPEAKVVAVAMTASAARSKSFAMAFGAGNTGARDAAEWQGRARRKAGLGKLPNFGLGVARTKI
jgi:hypothetical protein